MGADLIAPPGRAPIFPAPGRCSFWPATYYQTSSSGISGRPGVLVAHAEESGRLRTHCLPLLRSRPLEETFAHGIPALAGAENPRISWTLALASREQDLTDARTQFEISGWLRVATSVDDEPAHRGGRLIGLLRNEYELALYGRRRT